MNALIMVLALGFDSFLASLFFGAWRPSWREAMLRAFAFGACDGAATLVGAAWPMHGSPALMLCLYVPCAVAVLYTVRTPRMLLWAVAIALSLDNLVGGTPGELAPYVGASSAALSLLGSGVAALIRSRWLAWRMAL